MTLNNILLAISNMLLNALFFMFAFWLLIISLHPYFLSHLLSCTFFQILSSISLSFSDSFIILSTSSCPIFLMFLYPSHHLPLNFLHSHPPPTDCNFSTRRLCWRMWIGNWILFAVSCTPQRRWRHIFDTYLDVLASW